MRLALQHIFAVLQFGRMKVFLPAGGQDNPRSAVNVTMAQLLERQKDPEQAAEQRKSIQAQRELMQASMHDFVSQRVAENYQYVPQGIACLLHPQGLYHCF